MSKCVNCGKENHNGSDICNSCEEKYREQEAEQWYQEQAEEEQRDWDRRCEELK